MSAVATQSASKPLRSMTGFARVQGRVTESLGFTLSLKSVNHRFLDLHMRLPGGTEALEMELRRELKAGLTRGHVEVTLNLERSTRQSGGYNAEFVSSYLAAFRQAQQDFALFGEPDLNQIFRLPGALSLEAKAPNEESDALAEAVLPLVPGLIAALCTMREVEGALLSQELLAAMDRLAAGVKRVEALRREIVEAQFERIRRRMAELELAGADESRVLSEAALAAERSDVEEELARMRAHDTQFRDLLSHGGEAGKKMDFLLQEMNREANTMLSKTAGLAGGGIELTSIGLAMKADIEKAREQVQNIE